MHEIDQKIFYIITLLKFQNKIKGPVDFCMSIGLIKQTFNNIKNGRGHFTVSSIYKICHKYNVNPGHLFGTEENIFNEPTSTAITGNTTAPITDYQK